MRMLAFFPPDFVMTNHNPKLLPRRTFLSQAGAGLGGIALGSLLARESNAADVLSKLGLETTLAKVAPKAKSVIWFFMLGGTSHMESFDPKPQLTKHAGKTIEESPWGDAILKSPFYRKNVRDFAGTLRNLMPKLYPLQVGFRKRGESGIEVSDWWPHLGECVDDLSLVRSMWTTDNDHAAQLQFHTGRHIFDGFYPSIGSWVNYGLGTLNSNLPEFIVMGTPPADCCGGAGAHDGSYLGPEFSGVRLNTSPSNPLAFGTPGASVSIEERQGQLELLRQFSDQTAKQYPDDAALRARIKSYELAFRMQMAVPEAVGLGGETQATQQLYGMDKSHCSTVGRQALIARRLVERGVRFVQIYDNGWDAHSKLKSNHETRTKAVDQPMAGLLKDLKQRGLLDETLVVWGTEFGRTPGAERSDGRDHHPYGFSVWLAGGGIKGGTVHGATDEIGFHAAEDRHYVTDLHATVIHQLGLDPRALEVPGHKRLDIDFGKPIDAIIA